MQLLLELKDASEKDFLLKLLEQFDFVTVKPLNAQDELENQDSSETDFFSAAGMLAGSELDASQLRKEAWNIRD
ncbi:MAG: hypothetical protein AAFN92_02345 [Bacteroidota bacterium]